MSTGRPDAEVSPASRPICDAFMPPVGLREPLGIRFELAPEMPRAGQTTAWCAPTKNGAWGILFSGTPKTDTWQVMHVSRRGVRHTTDKESMNPEATDSFVRIVGDFDGDGEPEVFVGVEVTAMHPSVHQRKLLTVGLLGIKPYAPAAELLIDRLEDVDGDGRLDLVLAESFAPHPPYPQGFAGHTVRPQLLAHATPDGRFDLHDEVAKGFVRKQCPKRPGPFTAAEIDDGNSEISEAIEHVACALYWHVPKATLRAQVHAVCVKKPCWGLEDMLDEIPPFTLP